MNITFYILIILVTAFEIFADFLFKKWALGEGRLLLVAGIVAYTLSTIIWAFSLREESLSQAISIFTVLSLVLVVLMGVFVFHEQLSTLNIIGVILGVVSIILVSM